MYVSIWVGWLFVLLLLLLLLLLLTVANGVARVVPIVLLFLRRTRKIKINYQIFTSRLYQINRARLVFQINRVKHCVNEL